MQGHHPRMRFRDHEYDTRRRSYSRRGVLFQRPTRYRSAQGHQKRGYRIPEQIAVMGFSESQSALLTEPQLSSVAQPLDLIGETAANLLLENQESRCPEPHGGTRRANQHPRIHRHKAAAIARHAHSAKREEHPENNTISPDSVLKKFFRAVFSLLKTFPGTLPANQTVPETVPVNLFHDTRFKNIHSDNFAYKIRRFIRCMQPTNKP